MGALPRRAPARLAVVVTAGSLAVAAPLAAGVPAASAGEVRAVVTFTGTAPVTGAGVSVRQVFPHVGAELVTGPEARIRALSSNPRVTGISPDDTMSFLGHDNDEGDRGGKQADSVFAWEGIDKAGRSDSGAGVTVALLDTGVTDTPALNRTSGRLVDGVDTSRLRGGGDARTTGTFTDGYGHGTFMANLIAGGPTDRTPNKRGLGIAPASRVVVVKVADDQGNTSLSQVLAGFDWVATQAPKIQVVSVALGKQRPQAVYGADPLTAAVKHVTETGVLVVAAAGNTPGEVGDPGLAPQAITVGAADLDGGDDSSGRRPDNGKDRDNVERPDVTVAPFSGSGNVQGVAKPDIVASGVGLLSLMPARSVVAKKNPQSLQSNGFYRGSGTSESSAITTGAIAVLLSSHPEARLVDVKPALRVSADQIRGGRAQGRGLLDVGKAFKQLRKFNRKGGDDPAGENALNAKAWEDNSWLDGAWEDWLDDAWTENPWAEGGDWSANSWSANTWGDENWSASSWSASSWSASSWSASSWSAGSWSAGSWSAGSWSAGSWSAGSWSAGSWSASSWGDD